MKRTKDTKIQGSYDLFLTKWRLLDSVKTLGEQSKLGSMFKFCIPFYRSHKRKPVYRPSLKAANSSLESVRWTDKGTQSHDQFSICVGSERLRT